MKCCHCQNNAFLRIGEQAAPLCLSCHTTYKAALDNQIHSAYQLHQAGQIADAISGYMRDLPRKLHPTSPANMDRKVEVNNFHINDSNIGVLNTQTAHMKNVEITITDSSKSDSNAINKALHKLVK